MRQPLLGACAYAIAAGVVSGGVLCAVPHPPVPSNALSCGQGASARGVVKARAVKARTAALVAAGQFIGQDDGLFLYETPHGRTWMPAADDLWSLAVVEAEQEQQMYGPPQGLGVHRGDVVLDVGAHVGLFTRQALAAGAAKVITFEVTPGSNRALRRNLEGPIKEGRVVVIEQGAWFEEATLPLVIVERCSVCNSVSHPWMRATVDVALTTIDKVVQDLGLPHVGFMKLDIENAEANALRGAKQTLRRDHPRVAVALENAKDRWAYGTEVLGLLRDAYGDYGYTCGAMTPPARRTPPLPEVLHFYAKAST
jgi:FkbM family methyltransferase